MTPAARQLVVRLRALPRFEPDLAWKEQTRRRLLDRLNAEAARPHRRWAMYAGSEADLESFATAVHAAGGEWRPVAVEPRRLIGAVQAIRPEVVIIDAALPRRRKLAQQVRLAGSVDPVVLAQTDLAGLSDLLVSR